MAIQMSRFRNYNQKAAASELLAKQMANEQEDEAGFSQFMSIAAPLAASLILPGVGTALMGGLGGMASGGGVLASLLGGAGTAAAGTTAATAGTGILGALAGTGTGLASTIGGGLMAGAGKAAGTYALGEGMEKIGRESGYGGDEDEIDLSKYGRFGRKAERQAKASIRGSRDAMQKGQVTSALTSGVLGGVDKMGGFDKMKELSAGFGEKVGAGQMPWTSDAEFMEKMGNLTEADLLDGQIKPNQLTNIERIMEPAKESVLENEEYYDEFFGGVPLADGLPSGLDSLGNTIDLRGESSLISQPSPGSSTEYPQQIQDYISNNPDMTQEELDELLAMLGGQ